MAARWQFQTHTREKWNSLTVTHKEGREKFSVCVFSLFLFLFLLLLLSLNERQKYVRSFVRSFVRSLTSRRVAGWGKAAQSDAPSRAAIARGTPKLFTTFRESPKRTTTTKTAFVELLQRQQKQNTEKERELRSTLLYGWFLSLVRSFGSVAHSLLCVSLACCYSVRRLASVSLYSCRPFEKRRESKITFVILNLNLNINS